MGGACGSVQQPNGHLFSSNWYSGGHPNPNNSTMITFSGENIWIDNSKPFFTWKFSYFLKKQKWVQQKMSKRIIPQHECLWRIHSYESNDQNGSVWVWWIIWLTEACCNEKHDWTSTRCDSNRCVCSADVGAASLKELIRGMLWNEGTQYSFVSPALGLWHRLMCWRLSNTSLFGA